MCVSFFKVALIVVQVGLEASLVLIKFARITCVVFSVRRSGNNKAFVAKSFCVEHNRAGYWGRNCCLLLFYFFNLKNVLKHL